MRMKNVDLSSFINQICDIFGRQSRLSDITDKLHTKQKDLILMISEDRIALLKTKDCYVKGSGDNWDFKEFKDLGDVKMFMLEVTNTADNLIRGNVAKVEYQQFYNLTTAHEQAIEKVVFKKNGSMETFRIEDLKLTDLARFDVVESISGNDGGIYAAIDYINSLITTQIKTVDEKSFFSSLDASFNNKIEIEVIIIKPKERPRVEQISSDINSFQRQVDGLLRSIPHSLDGESVIICNDNDKKYAPNRSINGEMVHGTIVIAGFDNDTGEFKSLSPQQQKDYLNKYRNRERSDQERDL